MPVVNTNQLTPAPGSTRRQGGGQVVLPPPQGGGLSVAGAGSAGGIAPTQGSGIARGIEGAASAIQRSIEKRADQKRQDKLIAQDQAFRREQLRSNKDFAREQQQAQNRFAQSQVESSRAHAVLTAETNQAFGQLQKNMSLGLVDEAGVNAIFDRLAEAHNHGLSSPQMDAGAMAAQAFVSADSKQTDLAVKAQRDSHRSMMDPTQSPRMPDGTVDWGAHNIVRSTNTVLDVTRNLMLQEIKGLERAGNLQNFKTELEVRVADSTRRASTLAFSMFGAQLGSNRGIDSGIGALAPAFAEIINNNDTDAMSFKTILGLAAEKAGLPNFNAVLNALERGDAEATTANIAKGRGAREQRVAYASALQGVGVTLDFLAAQTDAEAVIDMPDGTSVSVQPSDEISKLARTIDQTKLQRLRSKLAAEGAALDATEDMGSHATMIRMNHYLTDMFETIEGVEAFTGQRIREDEIDPIMQAVFERHPVFREALEDEQRILRTALPAFGAFDPNANVPQPAPQQQEAPPLGSLGG